jgi:hypothetical protein
VYDCKASLHFSVDEVKEIIILYSDKHIMLENMEAELTDCG